jgi:hypothetical protein
LESIRALNKFKDCLNNEEEYGNDGVQFNGIIEYNVAGKITTEVLEVILIIGGYTPMVKLDIYEKGTKITKDNFHLDLDPSFTNTNFEFDETKESLIITGKNSPKLGNYTVEIREI